MVDLAGATRRNPQVLVGASPRGSLALLKLARCRAAMQGRDFVITYTEQRRASEAGKPPAVLSDVEITMLGRSVPL